MVLEWLARAENLKGLGLVIFFVTFCLVLLWVFASKDRLEDQKNIPFLDDDLDQVSKDKSNG
ncbi:MAG TPA: CcoQ/FixQ family Cbb3-type cytochrome c oxidase assembly chaperone [Parasulfuritortus sp.]